MVIGTFTEKNKKRTYTRILADIYVLNVDGVYAYIGLRCDIRLILMGQLCCLVMLTNWQVWL